MNGKLFISLLLLACEIPSFSQPKFPDNTPVFSDLNLPRIDVLIDPDSLDAIFSDVTGYHEYPATFIFNSGPLSDTVQSVGFRLRGNTSRNSPKKSYKISFNTFIPGQKFYGLEKLNINGEHNDPSVIRAKLCWDILREFGIPAPRSNHVELYVNGNYFGLYINVEHIDEEFVFSRFGNMDGNLFKCLWPATLDFFSSNPDDYKFTSGDRRAYDLRTNIEEDNYEDLYNLIYVLNTAPLGIFACEIEKIFNVDDFLKVLAFDVISGNWDGYSYNKNNYYLYNNTTTGKFEYIPYDLDNTLGIDWLDRDWGTRDIYDWARHGDPRLLHTRILEIQKYRNQFSYYINQLVTEIMDTTSLFPRIDSIHSMITPSIPSDPFYSLNYGYSVENFHQSYDQALGGHVPYGLKPYFIARIESAKTQLVVNNIVPVVKYISSNHPRLNENPVISAYVIDENPMGKVELLYSVNEGPEGTLEMFDNGTGADQFPGDHIYTIFLSPVSSESRIAYQVKVHDSEGEEGSLEPCQAAEIHLYESSDPDIVINEFMAGNDFTIADKYGEYDDWIEIYNRDPNPVWLGDKYLSDDLLNPTRWLMPDTILGTGYFILIWTDGQNNQGSLHSNFRLSKSGEEIGIFESPKRNSIIIDYLAFGAQTDDISYGRISDGGMDWILYSSATPGFSNTHTAIVEPGFESDPLFVYPNPVYYETIYFNKTVSVKLFDMTGRLWKEGNSIVQLGVGDIPPGLYLIRSEDGEIVKIVIH